MWSSPIKVKVNFRINDDGQLVITESDNPSQFSSPMVLPRSLTLQLAAGTIAARVLDGTLDRSMTLAAFCRSLGSLARQYDYDDCTVVEQWVDAEAA